MSNNFLSASERSALSAINGADVRPARFWLLRMQIALTMALFWVALMLFRSDLVLRWIGADTQNPAEMLSVIELRTISMIVLGGAVYLCLWFAKYIKLVLGVLFIVSCSNLLIDSYVFYLDSILALSPRPIISILVRGIFIAIIYSLFRDADTIPPPRALIRNPFKS